MSAFKKLEYKKIREYVASQIMEAIRNGEFKVGDKLPSEQAMAESIGVSRPSIREALGALRIVGIIETVNGVGTVVKKDKVEFLPKGGGPNYPPFWVTKETLLRFLKPAKCWNRLWRSMPPKP